MFTLLTNKTFLAGVAVGIVVGYTAHRYINSENKKINATDLAKDLVGVATKVGGIALAGKACGMGGMKNR